MPLIRLRLGEVAECIRGCECHEMDRYPLKYATYIDYGSVCDCVTHRCEPLVDGEPHNILVGSS